MGRYFIANVNITFFNNKKTFKQQLLINDLKIYLYIPTMLHNIYKF